MPQMDREKFHIVLDKDAIEKKGQSYDDVKKELLYYIHGIDTIPCQKIEGDYYYFEQECEKLRYHAADILFDLFADSKLLAGNFKTLYWWMEDEMFPFENEEDDFINALTECWKDNGFL